MSSGSKGRWIVHSKVRRRVGFGASAAMACVLVLDLSGLFAAGPAKASGPVASGSGKGFTSQIISIATTGNYDFNYHLKSTAGYCAEYGNGFTYESATVELVSSTNVTAMNFTTGPLVAWEVPGLSLGVTGDQEVNLAAGSWTLRISWACFNGGALASSWSYSIN